MTLDLFTQLWVAVFGVSALALVNCRSMGRRRLGVVLGLLAQPAWYAQLVIHEQWGMLPAFVAYTGVWLFALWNLLILPGIVILDEILSIADPGEWGR